MRIGALLSVVIGLVAAPVVTLSPTTAWAEAPTTSTCSAATPAALSSFFDSSLPNKLKQNNVPGAVVTVVSGGKTVFSKGYGLADVDNKVAMDPATSMVRVASITKLFTFTAVMQQVQAGKLNLNADVNTYLKAFKVPNTFPQPITVLDLMNHTAGFEDRIVGDGRQTAASVPPLGDFLAANMPRRIYPPGEISAYSNYGAGLAGYIVSQVSGEPYGEYIQRHILDPLGITHGTATEPVPAALTADVAHSYNSDYTPAKLVPFEFDPITPDGSVTISAEDMAKFMTLHLDGNDAVLSADTLATMHQHTFSVDPRLSGYAHGFMDKTANGHRVLMHDGSWEGFESVMTLVPDCDLGFFVSANATGGVDALTPVLKDFNDKFLPLVPAGAPVAGGKTTAPRAGFYQLTRHNETSVEKILVLLNSARLKVDADGTVHFKNKTWKSTGNGLYAATDGSDHLVFKPGTDGHLYAATDGPDYQLLPQSKTLPFNLVVLLVFAVAALSALLLPLVALVRRLRHRPSTASGQWRAARWLAAAASYAGILFILGFFAQLFGNTSDFLYGLPVLFKVVLLVPFAVLLAGAVSLGYTVSGWRAAGVGVLARIHQVVLLVGLVTLAWFILEWNLIGF